MDDHLEHILTALARIEAVLTERCAQHRRELDKNAEDIDGAFSRIRHLEKFQARMTVIQTLLLPILTAVLVKYFVR